MPFRSPETWGDVFRLVLAFASMISGGAGGSIVASTYVLRRRIDSFAMAVAHVFVGLGVGFGVTALSPFIPMVDINTIEEALMFGFVVGLLGSISLASTHIAFRISARRWGVEEASIQIKLRDEHDWESGRRKERHD